MIQKSIKEQVEESILTKHLLIESGLSDIEEAAGLLIDAVNTSKKILWCGNGGSAADAQHLATELMGGMSDHDRKPIPSIALTTDSSFITAWANDTDFSSIFSRIIFFFLLRPNFLFVKYLKTHSGRIAKLNKLSRVNFGGVVNPVR